MDKHWSFNRNPHIRSNKFWNEDHDKRQTRTLYNDQSINPRKRYNNYEHICTQNKSTSISKANASKY